MSSFVEALNHGSEFWWSLMTASFLQSSLVACVMLLVVAAAGRRIPSPLRSALLLLAFVKFILPPVWSTSFGLFALIPVEPPSQVTPPIEVKSASPADDVARTLPIATPVRSGFPADEVNHAPSEPPDSEAAAVVAINIAANSPAPPVTHADLSTHSWMMILHLLGTAFLVAVIMRVARGLNRQVAMSQLVSFGAASDLFLRVRGEFRIRRKVELRASNEVRSPLAAGLLRPVVLVPRRLLEELPADELRALFAHELAHHRRFDPWINVLQSLVLSVWWFHPFAWLLHMDSRRVREQCCDDAILKTGLTTASDYSRLLVRMAEEISQPRVRTSVLSAADQLYSVAARLQHVMDKQATRVASLSWRAVVVLLLAAALLLPGMSRPSQAQTAPPVSSAIRNSSSQLPASESTRDRSLPDGAILKLGADRYRHGGHLMMREHGRLFLRDSTTVIGFSPDGMLRYWDVRTGEAIRDPGIDLQGAQAMKLSPDRSTIAVLGMDRDLEAATFESFVKLFDTDGKEKSSFRWVEPRGVVKNLLWTPDGLSLVTVASNGILRVWDIASGTEILTHENSNKSVSSMSISPDGRTLAWIARHREVHLWNWLDNIQEQPLAGSPDRVDGLQFSPDGGLLATSVIADAKVLLWDTKSGEVVRTLADENLDPLRVSDMAFTPDGRQLVTPSSNDNAIHIWDVESGTLSRTLDTGNKQPRFVDISPDGKWLVSDGIDSMVCAFNLETGEAFTSGEEISQSIADVRYSPDGTEIITASRDAIIRQWDASTGHVKRMLRHERTPRVTAFSPDGSLLASNSMGDTVKVWRAETGEELLSLFGHGNLGGNRAVSFTPDGRQLLAWGDDLFLRVWDVRTGKAIHEHALRPDGLPIQETEDGGVQVGGMRYAISLQSGQFSRDGKLFLLALVTGCHLYDVATGKELQRIPIQDVNAAVINGDGSMVATISPLPEERKDILFNNELHGTAPRTKGDLLQVIEVRTGEPLQEIGLPYSFLRKMTLSDDNQLLAISGHYGQTHEDRTNDVRIYDVATGKLRYHVTGIPLAVHGIAMSPDGKHLVTSMWDSTLLVWDLSQFRVDSAAVTSQPAKTD
ncbi:MAG: M56 family metallopeptidase [Fuerstiella sp.]